MSKKKELLNAIVTELEIRKTEINEPIETIYFGGGTPSVLSVKELNFILDAVYDKFNIIDKPEITIEANPDDLNNEKIVELSKTKINRLSIGIQSFFNDDLKFMNRAHSSEEALNSLKIAIKHFRNISIDLIYGVPNLSNEKWIKNLEIAFDLGVNHISSYALTVETKTALYHNIKNGKIKPLNENKALEQFTILLEKTRQNNYINYETSNFGKANYFSKHNTSYWLGKQYIGIGPSAHSFNGKTRSWNVNNNIKYIKSLENKVLPHQKEVLSQNDLFNEKVMIGLRTIWGISVLEVENQFGLSIKKQLLKRIQKHLKNNTLQIIDNKITATKKGKFLIDGIASDLFLV